MSAPIHLPTRSKLLEHIRKPDMTVCEVGVLVGDFARQMVVSLAPKTLVLVDYWRNQGEQYTGGYGSMTDGEHKTNFLAVCERFANLQSGETPGQLAVLKMLSTDAAKLFANRAFDLVYLDANHSYDAVKADICSWMSKVKLGGWLAGHDYTGCHEGVKRAVNEWLGEPDIVTDEYEMGSWATRIHFRNG